MLRLINAIYPSLCGLAAIWIAEKRNVELDIITTPTDQILVFVAIYFLFAHKREL